ncbi:MAG: glycosyltransferase [Peptococcaceae bacterium]|nr:glycosyltransferase [Peptococcaceae bacterium]
MVETALKKMAILSHALPPDPSGQAIVLYRLLQKLNSAAYCLISSVKYDCCSSTESSCLPGNYIVFKPPYQLSRPTRWNLFKLRNAINMTITIISRAKQLVALIRMERCEVLVACTGDFADLPAAYLATKWTKILLIPYVFDDYAYQWIGLERTAAKLLEPKIIKGAHTVIVPNENMRNEYLLRYGVDSEILRNPTILPNLSELDQEPKIFNTGEVNIVYTGSIYHAHYDAFRNIIAAIRNVEHKTIKLHLYTSQPKAKLVENGVIGEMVVYHGHIAGAEVPKVLRQADILFLPLAFKSAINEVIKTSAPGKTGEYLAMGKPILVHAPPDSFLSWFFEKNECGVVVNEDDSTAVQIALERIILDDTLKENLARRAREVAEQEFDVNIVAQQFIKLLNNN